MNHHTHMDVSTMPSSSSLRCSITITARLRAAILAKETASQVIVRAIAQLDLTRQTHGELLHTIIIIMKIVQL